MKIFPEIGYFALKQMARINRGAQIDESDDERIVNGENKEENDEFTTYFTDNRVEIPNDDKVSTVDVSAMSKPILVNH